MMQSDKSATDKTKSQLLDGIRKSKAAGATPARTGVSEQQAAKPAARPASSRRESVGAYALGGLRWPD